MCPFITFVPFRLKPFSFFPAAKPYTPFHFQFFTSPAPSGCLCPLPLWLFAPSPSFLSISLSQYLFHYGAAAAAAAGHQSTTTHQFTTGPPPPPPPLAVHHLHLPSSVVTDSPFISRVQISLSRISLNCQYRHIAESLHKR